MEPSNRREFCRTVVGGAAGLSLAWCAPKAFSQNTSSALSTTKVTDSVALITGSGSNVIVITGPDGALMINGGLAERSAELLKAVSDLSGGRPVQGLINTDWHFENTGSNDTLGKSGVKIISHENTKLWMGTEFHVQWQNRTYKPRAKEALPNKTFYTTDKMTFGKEVVEFGHLGQAHTDGDIYVFLPGQNILLTGDLFTVGSYPILDWSTGGWIGGYNAATGLPQGGLSEGLANLVKLGDAQTRVIPGSGPVQAKADLQAHADMSLTLSKRFVDLMRKGMSAGDMFRAAPTKDFDAKYGDPKQFMTNVYPGLWNHVRELGGIV